MRDSKKFEINRRSALVGIGLIATLGSQAFAGDATADGVGNNSSKWYKGNTHTHTFWSDGDDFPEMAASWYKEHGYDFLALSDHNSVMTGEVWRSIDQGKRFVPSAIFDACQKRFGANWLETRMKGDERQVKLKTFAEVAAKVAEPEKFLLVQADEISTSFEDRAVHLCVFDLPEPFAPKVGQSVAETISLNVALAKEQSARLNRRMPVHVNHPNFAMYDVTPEDLAASTAEMFEVCNGHPGVRNLGDATHPSVEKLWDVANTIRIAKMNAAPLLAVGSDDAHQYQKWTAGCANPGRAWTMIRAKELTAAALAEAMCAGDMYASSGVVLSDVAFDAKTRTLHVAVAAEPGVTYTIEFIGTPKGIDPAVELIEPPAGEKMHRPGRKYSPEIGKVFSSVQGASASYRLTGDELYVRAVVRSDKPITNPSYGAGKLQEAWCQPVGWEK